MISIKTRGDYKKTFEFLNKISKGNYARRILDKYGRQGVEALSASTPRDSGETASLWDYYIESSDTGIKVVWTNSHVNKGVPIAIILQYGHGTGTGGYVQGRDYINPALRPVFDNVADEIWREVTR